MVRAFYQVQTRIGSRHHCEPMGATSTRKAQRWRSRCGHRPFLARTTEKQNARQIGGRVVVSARDLRVRSPSRLASLVRVVTERRHLQLTALLRLPELFVASVV